MSFMPPPPPPPPPAPRDIGIVIPVLMAIFAVLLFPITIPIAIFYDLFVFGIGDSMANDPLWDRTDYTYGGRRVYGTTDGSDGLGLS